MTTVLHFDIAGGASGDMLMAALIGAGVPTEYLRNRLSTLPIANEFELEVDESFVRNGLSGVQVRVRTISKGPSPARNIEDVLEIIEESGLAPQEKEIAKQAFHAVAKAEAFVHGTEPSKVHFHEVGAVDSIVDICGYAIAIGYLSPDRITSSPLPMGRGKILSSHGEIPLPAPATLKLIEGMPVVGTKVRAELVTPTAAALIKVSVEEFVEFPTGTIQKTGIAIGHKDIPAYHNILRAIVLSNEEQAQDSSLESIYELSCVVDDLSPAILAATVRKLLDIGALDSWMVPIVMKKGRPGYELRALTDATKLNTAIETIIKSTRTLGVRMNQVSRIVLNREQETIETKYGKVRRKVRHMPDGERIHMPELDDCERISSETGKPMIDILEELTEKKK